jgi:hypothetical protein
MDDRKAVNTAVTYNVRLGSRSYWVGEIGACFE